MKGHWELILDAVGVTQDALKDKEVRDRVAAYIEENGGIEMACSRIRAARSAKLNSAKNGRKCAGVETPQSSRPPPPPPSERPALGFLAKPRAKTASSEPKERLAAVPRRATQVTGAAEATAMRTVGRVAPTALRRTKVPCLGEAARTSPQGKTPDKQSPADRTEPLPVVPMRKLSLRKKAPHSPPKRTASLACADLPSNKPARKKGEKNASAAAERPS